MSWKAHHIGTPGVLAQLAAFTGHIILVSGRTNVNFITGLGGDGVIVCFISWDNHHHRANVQGLQLNGMVQTVS